ncbi:hypothetical protein [Kitasatospora sp. NPDC059673]|uniref:hypothetical protein n=1 Tax=Kitasatospora sp. NPDC059673 TaxID=3346901 RepID=UPI0036A8D346
MKPVVRMARVLPGGAARAIRALAPGRVSGSTPAGLAPLPHDGPAMLRVLALAEVLAVVPPGGLAAGERAEVLPLP